MNCQPPDPGGSELSALVLGFEAVTPREVASRDRFLRELERLGDPFDRNLDPVHVTASALVSGPVGTVLHLHKRLGMWLQPGGHVDAGETPHEAAVRETREETGLRARHPDGVPYLLHLDVHPAGSHVHLDLRYLVLVDDEELAPAPGESPQVQWFSLEEALRIADDALVDGLHRLATWRGTRDDSGSI